VKTALITGVTGQDGSYLAEFLLSKGYKVVGLKRRSSEISTSRIDHLFGDPNFLVEYYNLNDCSRAWQLLIKYKPDEVYNLAAQSHVRVSFETTEETVSSIVMGTLHLLNGIKEIVPEAKFYQASSSEMYGDNWEFPFNEESALKPVSPYACAKVCAHHLTRNYREGYGLHASSGILFNHESPRRGETFVTRKITRAAVAIKAGLQDKLYLGNLDAKRDWGFAGDYVQAMWLMLQQEYADDYVIATGQTHSVKEFLEYVFEIAGLDIDKHVEIDERLFRPTEVPYLLGDSSKAQKTLGWKPTVDLKELAKMMYDSDWNEMCRKYNKNG
tara:strand:- start:1789 stop:2772 length:984 start_codon:yes stop_codon:yes gene_type:complete